MAKILKVSFLIFGVIAAASAQCPSVVPRGGWNARTGGFVPVLGIRPSPFVVVHATGTASCAGQSECSAIIRDIQTFQMDSNSWPQISYHFLIGEDGQIYEGRGWGRQGENVGNFNNQAINVGLIGQFTTAPTAATLALVNSLIDCGIAQGALPQDVSIVAQCQVVNFVACPANSIFAWLSDHPRFEGAPSPV